MTPGSCRPVPEAPRHPGEQCCAQSLPVRNRRRTQCACCVLVCRACCALCGSESAWRHTRVAIFCLLRGLTPATHLILWRNRWLRPRRPVILHGARGRLRLSLPKNPVRQRDRCDVCYPRLPSGRFVDPPRPAIAACVSCRAGVERSPPVHKSADTGSSGCSARDTYEGHFLRGCRRTRLQETGLRSATK